MKFFQYFSGEDQFPDTRHAENIVHRILAVWESSVCFSLYWKAALRFEQKSEVTKKVSCAQHNMNLQFIYVKLLSTSSTRLEQTSCGLNQGATSIQSFCFCHRLYTAWKKHTKYGNKKDGIASFLPLGVLYKIYRYVPLVKGIAFEPFFGKRI